jgi:hypothetical protein
MRTWSVYLLVASLFLPSLCFFAMLAIANRGQFSLRALLIVITLAAITLGVAVYFAGK